MIALPDQPPPRHRGLFWSAIVLALAALAGGSVFAYATYTASAGPDGSVKGYFAALSRGDAPAALGFGDRPPGQNQLLTSTVLRAQQKIAPVRHVEILSSDQSGDEATVTVRYQLEFAGGVRKDDEDVKVVRHNGSWRLVQTAALTHLRLRHAGERATIVGAAVPDGEVLIFPGAVPIAFDTPALRLSASTNSVALSAPAETTLDVQLTETGRSAVDAALTAALHACVGGGLHADPRCPLPNARTVPGSVRATVLAAAVRRAAKVTLATSAAGLLTISGTLRLTAGYTTLDFNNQPVARKGMVTLPLAASAYVADPSTIDWSAGQ